MDFEALKTLVQTHPDIATISDEDLTAWCNEKVINRIADRINSDVMYELIDGAEFTALSQEQQNEIWNMLLLFANSGIPTAAGTRARSRFIAIFGAGSSTIANVVGAVTYQVSRVAASEPPVGADEVDSGEVNHARNL